MLAGFRTATVNVVATASVAARVAWGGLGRYIVDGLAQKDYGQLIGGAFLVGVLSTAIELGLCGTQRLITPAGLRRAGRGTKQSVLPGTVSAPEPVGGAA